MAGLVAITAGAVLFGGIAGAFGRPRVVPPPDGAHRPAVAALSPAARASVQGDARPLRRDAARRAAQRLTLRVRNLSCEGVATGSGFALDRHTVVTNAHVLAGADRLELDAWDGASFESPATRARMGRSVDIGFARVDKPLPVVARMGPRPQADDRVTAVGFPLGGAMTLSAGRVLRIRDGRGLAPGIAFRGRVLELSVRVKHGNSGGPLLDARGRVAGPSCPAPPDRDRPPSGGVRPRTAGPSSQNRAQRPAGMDSGPRL